MNKKSTVTIGDNIYDLPLIDGTIGPSVIDVSKLYGDQIFSHMIQDLLQQQVANLASPILMEIKGNAFIEDIQWMYLPRKVTF